MCFGTKVTLKNYEIKDKLCGELRFHTTDLQSTSAYLTEKRIHFINVYHPRNCLRVLEHQGLIGIDSPSNTGKAQRFIFL